MKRAGALACAVALAAAGCATRDEVVRVVDGRAVVGDYVPPEAYAEYLRGSIAEASGDWATAIDAYDHAARYGPTDPAPWARLGVARCMRDAGDPLADRAIDRAIAIDDGFAPAWEARAVCASRRGPAHAGEAAAAAKRAIERDPGSRDALAVLAREPGMRDRLLAAAVATPTDLAAWRALATWAEANRDPGLAQLAAERAAALADERPTERDVRRAIDRAVVARDVVAVEKACGRSRVPRAVAAARALLLGAPEIARALAQPVVDADPQAVDARMVLVAAADAARDDAGLARAMRGVAAAAASAPVAIEPWLVYARVVARRGSRDAARALTALLAPDAIAPRADEDPLVTPVLAQLAADGVIDARQLGPNARARLGAVARGEPGRGRVVE